MPFNGSGVFQRVRSWMADASAGIKIRADYHDAEDDGFAAGLTNTITKDGQTLITQNIPFNSKRITGLADPINPQDAATKASVDARVAAPGVITGDLQIKKTSASITLNSNPNGANAFSGLVNDKQRWLMRPGDGGGETGSNVGSDFDIHRYDDLGNYLGRSLLIARANGAWTIGGPVYANSLAAPAVHASGGDLQVSGWSSDPNNGVLFMNAARTQYINNVNNTFSFTGYISAAYPTLGNHAASAQYVQDAISGKLNRAGDTMTGTFYPAASQDINYAGSAGSIEVRSSTPAACISFHLTSYGVAWNLGMKADGNLYIGGWSHGSNFWQVWTKRDFAALPTAPSIPGHLVTDTRLNYVADYFHIDGGGFVEPHAGCVVTGDQEDYYNPGGGGYGSLMRYRALQVQVDGGWYTVGYTG